MNRTSATAPDQILTVDMMLAKMREGTKTEFDIGVRGQRFKVRVLSLDEMNEIRRFSIQEAQRVGGDQVDRNVEMQKATLKLGSTLTKNGGPGIPDGLLNRMTTEEMNELYSQYVAAVDSVNPTLEAMPEGEFRAMVDALKKNQITWRDCSLRQLRAICTGFQELIQELAAQTSPPDSLSGGPQSE